MKKIISILLSLCMLIGLVTVGVSAEEPATSGSCGDNLTWNFDEATGTLTISGEGEMWDFVETYAPWRSVMYEILTLNIEDGVTSIGASAFQGCKNLHTVVIPDSVTKIGNSAFLSCWKLENITIPENVTDLGDDVFTDDPFLENLVDEQGFIIINHSLIEYVGSEKDVVIPDGVASICGPGFRGRNDLTSIAIPDSVTRIGSEAFRSCHGLSYIDLPEGITEIRTEAFWQCGNLKSITIPDGITSIDGYMFADCTSLTEVIIPDSVTRICEYAFMGCESLAEIDIPGSVTYIGMDAFFGTPFYESVVDQNGFAAVNDILIGYQGSGGNVVIPDGIVCIGSGAMDMQDDLTSVTIPDGVVSIEESAFANCPNLTSVTIPNTVTSIGAGAFGSCRALTDISLPDQVTSIGNSAFFSTGVSEILVPKNVTVIPDEAFSNCDNLTNVVIPDWVTSIGEDAFWDCDNLVSVTIPDSVMDIDDGAFSCCKALADVMLPESITRISAGTFIDCSSLVSIKIPASVTSIDREAFYSCDGMTSITIPGSVTSIESRAFADCSELRSIVFQGDAPQFVAYKDEDTGTFLEAEAAVYYPEDNETWADVVTQNYGGEITWIPYDRTTQAPGLPFTDVAYDAYFAKAVEWAVENSITAGITKTTFSPNADCTRAQVVTFLWRAAGEPAPTSTVNPFSDVKSTDYFYKAVLWAVENNITLGMGNGKFGVKETCTREQVATFLYRAAGEPEVTDAENPFSDVKTTDYSYGPILWAVENGITQGTGANTFSPKATCTRAQIVTFLYRFEN